MSSRSPVVVIGSGINGLVAAALLARAGRPVTVLERNDLAGGLIATEELTEPGFRHDTFSSWHGSFLGGPAYPLLESELAARGLEWKAAEDLVCGTLRSDGGFVALRRDLEQTVEGLGVDGVAYRVAAQQFATMGPDVAALLNVSPMSRRAVAPLVRLVGRGMRARGPSRWSQEMISSWAAWAQHTFEGSHVDALLAPWVLHAGLTPQSALSALTGRLMAGGLHRFGLPVLRGGSAGLVEALCDVIRTYGGEVRTGAEAAAIEHVGGRVRAVRLSDGAKLPSLAVLASVTPSRLGEMVKAGGGAAGLPSDLGLRPGRAAMQIHVALSSAPRWSRPEAARTPMLHLTDGSAEIAVACAQATAGVLPRRPTVVVGQQYLLDPDRVPPGRAALWIQLQEVPAHPVADAGAPGERLEGWTPDLERRYVRRILNRVAEHAPGLHDLVLGVTTLGPEELTRRNVSVVAGDPYGGATELDQNLFWRPRGTARNHRLGPRGLWHIGASAHPGPGLSGASGTAAVRELLGARDWHKLTSHQG